MTYDDFEELLFTPPFSQYAYTGFLYSIPLFQLKAGQLIADLFLYNENAKEGGYTPFCRLGLNLTAMEVAYHITPPHPSFPQLPKIPVEFLPTPEKEEELTQLLEGELFQQVQEELQKGKESLLMERYKAAIFALHPQLKPWY